MTLKSVMMWIQRMELILSHHNMFLSPCMPSIRPFLGRCSLWEAISWKIRAWWQTCKPACESLHHKSLNFREEEGGRGTISWVTCQLFLPHTSTRLNVVARYKHHQTTLTSGIWNQGLNIFFTLRRTHDWCTVPPSSSPGTKINLHLNNTPNLFVIFALTLKLR